MAVLESEIAGNSVARAWQLYYQIRSKIEIPENIGRLILLDVDSGDYEIAQDKLGFAASALLRQRHPDADPLALRIGYEAVEVLGGVMERISSE